MKRFAAVGVALAAVSAFAQEAEPETFDKLGLSIELDFGQTEVAKRFQAKDYKGALEELEAQLKLLGRADESVPQRWKERREANVRYDMACARARLGEADAAVAEFVRAVELGFWDWKHLAQDSDLDTIRERPEFVAAVEAGKAAEALEVKALVAAAVADVERSLAEGPLVADYDLSGELLGGGRFALADHKGKVVLIAQFFASYGSERVLYPHLPLLNELAAAYKDKPLACAGAAFKIAGDPDGELLPAYAGDYLLKGRRRLDDTDRSRDRDDAGFEAAVVLAAEADAVVLFLGEEAILSGEAHCRADIRLPGRQEELLRRVCEAGRRVILVLMAGRPLALTL